MSEDELALGQKLKNNNRGFHVLARIHHHLITRPFDDARKNRGKTGEYVDPFTGFKSGGGYYEPERCIKQMERRVTRELYEHIYGCLVSLNPARESLSAEWQQLQLRHRQGCMERLSRVY